MRALSLTLIVCALASPAWGCGGDGGKAERDAELAAQIRASAALFQQERDQRERDAEAERQQTTTAVPGGDALPAGSQELDGGGSSGGGGSRALLSQADRESFARLAVQLSGEEGVAVSTLGLEREVSRAGSLRGGAAWSTAKVPVAMATIIAGVGSRADREAAITASDNAAAERLWSALGEGKPAAAAATEQLRAAGDKRTVVEPDHIRSGFTAFGQTAWRLTDQARFMAGIACAQAGPELLGLMSRVVAGQRWGLGATGADAQLKGGWGPGISPGSGDGWLDRQMGVLTIKGKPIAVAIATTGGGHETGTSKLTEIARWVASHVDVRGAPGRPAC